MSEQVVLYLETDRDFIPKKKSNQQVITRIKMQTSDELLLSSPQTDCSILLLIDTSQSMEGAFSTGYAQLTRREGVRLAAESMIQLLQPRDQVTLVFFNTRAYEVARDVSGTQKRALSEHLQTIHNYNGSTHFEAAFAYADAWAQEQPTQKSKRILFLTDGQSTVGSWTNTLQLAEKVASLGATVDCLGVGEDFAFDAMQSLSGPSGGTTQRLFLPNDAKRAFREILQNAQRALIHDVLLQIRIPPDRRDVEIYQTVPEIRFSMPPVDATGGMQQVLRIGDIYHHQTAEVLISMKLDTDTPDSNLVLFHCRLDYAIPSKGWVGLSHQDIARVNLSEDPRRERRDSSVFEEYTEASLVRDEAEFRQIHTQDWKRAVQLLQQMKQKAANMRLMEKERAFDQAIQQMQQTHALSRDQLNQLFAQNARSTRSRSQPVRQAAKPIQF